MNYSHDANGHQSSPILLIDDNMDFTASAAEVLTQADYEVWSVSCPEDAFALLLQEHKPRLLICDLHMPFTSDERQKNYKFSFEVGIKTMRELSWALPGVPLVGMSAAAQLDLDRIKHMVPAPLYSKPSRPGELLAIVKYLLGEQMH